MDNFISLGFGPEGMTAFVGLFLEDAAAGSDSTVGHYRASQRLGLGV